MRPGLENDGPKKYQAHFNRLIKKREELNSAIAKDDSQGPGYEFGFSSNWYYAMVAFMAAQIIQHQI